jgi:hypothetical protein
VRAPLSRPRIVAALVATVLLAPIGAIVVTRALTAKLPPPAVAAPSAAAIAATAPPEARTPEIHGRILDADGNAVRGAAVRLVSPRLPYIVYSDTKSDASGTFSFARVGPEVVRVVADHDPDGAVTSAELHVAQDQNIELTLVLSAANAVRGTVVDTEDHPVAGAAVFAEGVPWIARGATSDADGTFRLALVPDGVTSLVAVARGYKTARAPVPRAVDSLERVVRVRLEKAAALAGDVRDPDGNAVRARVVACEGQPSEATAVSGDDGTFELPPSTIGCEAVAQHDEFEASDAVALVEGHRIALRLKPGGAIEGAVVQENGAAVESFTIGIESFSGAQSRSLRSKPTRKVDDPRGAFRLEKLAPGHYVIGAGAPGMAPGRSAGVDVAGGATTTGVRIVMPSGGSVVGHVFDEHHAPLDGVELRFDAVSNVIDSSARAQTDAAGRYRLDGAPMGLLTLRAEKAGYRVRMLSGLQVASRGTLTRDLTLNAIDGGAGLEFGGVGANLSQAPEGLAFAAVFPGEPAERAGLLAGDRILAIDAETADGMSLADALQRLRGEAGTTVGVSVQRPKTGETVDVLIERAVIVR